MATNLPDSSLIATAAESTLPKESDDIASSPELIRRHDSGNLSLTIRSLDEINGGTNPSASKIVSYLQDDLYRNKPPSAPSGVGRVKKKSLCSSISDAAASSSSNNAGDVFPHELTPLNLVDGKGSAQLKNRNGSLKHLAEVNVTSVGGNQLAQHSQVSTKSLSDNEDESSQLL